MLVVFPPIFVADTKIIHGYNFVAPLRKQINGLLSKGMSNIYLKVTIETFSKLGMLQLKNQTSGRKALRGFSII